MKEMSTSIDDMWGEKGGRQRTLEGEEFIVELVAGVELEELVGGDDEGICGGVLCNLKGSHIVLAFCAQGDVYIYMYVFVCEREKGLVITYNVVCQTTEKSAQCRSRLIPLVKQCSPCRSLSLRHNRRPWLRRQRMSSV